jgi:hypothetical protein
MCVYLFACVCLCTCVCVRRGAETAKDNATAVATLPTWPFPVVAVVAAAAAAPMGSVDYGAETQARVPGAPGSALAAFLASAAQAEIVGVRAPEADAGAAPALGAVSPAGAVTDAAARLLARVLGVLAPHTPAAWKMLEQALVALAALDGTYK